MATAVSTSGLFCLLSNCWDCFEISSTKSAREIHKEIDRSAHLRGIVTHWLQCGNDLVMVSGHTMANSIPMEVTSAQNSSYAQNIKSDDGRLAVGCFWKQGGVIGQTNQAKSQQRNINSVSLGEK